MSNFGGRLKKPITEAAVCCFSGELKPNTNPLQKKLDA
jgi:hypothetical protein